MMFYAFSTVKIKFVSEQFRGKSVTSQGTQEQFFGVAMLSVHRWLL
jgi:hypothetical protein